MQAGVGDSGSDSDAVLDILSRPDDDDLADVVELVAKICDAQAAGITLARGDDYHVPITYGIQPFVSPATLWLRSCSTVSHTEVFREDRDSCR